jgi:hypothetical protein
VGCVNITMYIKVLGVKHKFIHSLNKKTMKQGFLFTVDVNYGYKVVKYYTNAIMSKNDGALIAFRDEDNNMLNESPEICTISVNQPLIFK